MSTEFIDALANEVKEDPFSSLVKEENDTPAESSPENNNVKEEPVQGEIENKPSENTEPENEPFHKRWQAREEKLKRELEEKRLQDIEALRQEFEQRFTSRPASEEDVEIPKWFVTLYGEDPVAYKAMQEADAIRKEEIKRELIENLKQEQLQAQQEEQKWNKWVDEGIASLEEQGLKFNRNELINTMLQYGPTDEEGNYDFKKGYDILVALKGPQNTSTTLAKKKVASLSSTSKGAEPNRKPYMTSADLRHKSWDNL